MSELRIEFDDGSVERFIILEGQIVEGYMEQSHVELEILRDEWFDIVNDIDRVNDEFYIENAGEDIFGGRLVTANNEDSQVYLEVGSFEEDALDAQPTDDTEKFEAPDSEIVEDAISRVPNLEPGEIETINQNVDILFSNTSPAGMIREIQRTTRGFVRYNANKTVDYIQEPTRPLESVDIEVIDSEEKPTNDILYETDDGEDRVWSGTTSYTIFFEDSGFGFAYNAELEVVNSEGSVIASETLVASTSGGEDTKSISLTNEEFSKIRISWPDGDGTEVDLHGWTVSIDEQLLPEDVVGVVGPDESNVEDRFEVKEDERDEYTHVRVLGAQEGQARIDAEAVTDSYDGGREVWRKYPDKSITSESRAQDIANEIAFEMDTAPRVLEIDTVLFGLDVEVGDRLSVVSTVDNIDSVLRVVETRNRLEGQTTVIEVRLSNRLIFDETQDEKRRRDVERYNQGFQGDVVSISAGGYRAPIDEGIPYTFSVRQPDDVVQELTAELEIEGLRYRAYSAGAQVIGGEHVHEVDLPFSNLNHNHSFTFSTSDHSHLYETTEETSEQDRSEIIQESVTLESGSASTPISQVVSLNDGGSSDVIIQVTGTFVGSEGETEQVTLNVKNDGVVESSSYSLRTFESDFSLVGYLPREDRTVGDVELELTANGEELSTVTANITAIGDHVHSVEVAGETSEDGSESITDSTEDQEFTDETVGTSEEVGSGDDSDPNPGVVEFDLFPGNIDVFVNGEFVVRARDTLLDDLLEFDAETPSTGGFNTEFTLEENDEYPYNVVGEVWDNDTEDDPLVIGVQTDKTFNQEIMSNSSIVRSNIRFNEAHVKDDSSIEIIIAHGSETDYNVIDETSVSGLSDGEELTISTSESISTVGEEDSLIVAARINPSSEASDEDRQFVDFSVKDIDVGTGYEEFTEVVEIDDQLEEGFNKIEVYSDVLGHLRATAFLDVYRQITQ